MESFEMGQENSNGVFIETSHSFQRKYLLKYFVCVHYVFAFTANTSQI